MTGYTVADAKHDGVMDAVSQVARPDLRLVEVGRLGESYAVLWHRCRVSG